MSDIEFEHRLLVSSLFRKNSVGSQGVIHGALGVSKEAGELLDCAYRHWNYGQPLNRENAIEECGDIEFYLHAFRNAAGITRDETLEGNIAKLRKRYPEGYTDFHAQTRLDKQ